ncbi:MAG: hypothetical protein QOE05_1241 [Actinomycetota bacterium]|nr:hypothetical protein [Actinomycetota bacterium]
MSADNETGQPGSHAANQPKTEPIPPSPTHADPDAAPEPTRVETPDLESMNVGATDPQAPSHDGAAGATAMPSVSGVPSEQTPVLTGADPAEVAPSAHAGTTTGRTSGPVEPVQDTAGDGHRQPGSLGSTGPDEQLETDVERSAQNASTAGAPGTASGPGDAGGVPVTSAYPAAGTSEESAVAQGTRTPQ